MAGDYGVEITGNNNSYLVSSNTTATEYLTVVDTDTVAAGGSVTKQASDLIFAKPTSSTIGSNNVYYDNITSQTSVKFYAGVSYVILRKTQSTSTSGNYGIQVKNNSGTIIFDSRAATSGLKVTSTVAETSLGGARQPYQSGMSPVTSTSNSYPNFGTNESTIAYSGNPTNVYVACTSGYYQFSGFDIVFNGLYYDYTNNRILHAGFIRNPFDSTTSLFNNFSTLMFGELVT